MHFGGHESAHFKAVIKRHWRCTWRPCLCELEGHDRASSEFHLEAEIKWVWRYTFGCHDRATLEEYLEAGNLEAVVWDGGATGAETLFIHQLVLVGMWQNCVHHGLPTDERLAVRQLISGWCSVWCMQGSVYAVLGVIRTQCILYSVLTLDHGMDR